MVCCLVVSLLFVSFIVRASSSVTMRAAKSSSAVGRKIRTTVALSAAAERLGGTRYFLLKSEPDEFSIDSLAHLPGQRGPWDGVRNVQARNHLRAMQCGDRAFFYHSSCGKATGIYGVCEVTRTAFPDMGAVDPLSERYDPKAPEDGSKWSCVEVKLVEKWPHPVHLSALKACSFLKDMTLFQQSRLSVQPVSAEHWTYICDTLRPS